MPDGYSKYNGKNDIHWKWYYGGNSNYRQLVDETLAPFADPATPRGTILDVGCGDGLPMSLLQAMGYRCYGVEPLAEAVDIALDHRVAGEFFIQTAEEFAARDMVFDYLLCLNTIEHLEQPRAMVDIMKKIRNFGVVVTDNRLTKANPDLPSNFHNREFSPPELAAWFGEFSLHALNITNRSFFGYKIFPKVKPNA